MFLKFRTRLKHYIQSLQGLSLILLTTLSTDAGAQDASARNPALTLLSPQQIASDVDLAKEAYARIHPGYSRYTEVEVLNSAWESITTKARTENGLTLGDFYLEIEQVLTLIRCDHTKAEIPSSLRRYREAQAVYLPFRWEYIDGRGFVTGTEPNSPLQWGDEIIEIDGMPLSTMVERVAPFIPVDGYTEWSRRGGIAQSLEFMGGAVDHFGSLLWETSQDVTVKLQAVDGTQKTQTLSRVNYTQYRQIESAQTPAGNFKNAVTFERIGDNAAYLSVDTFVNYRDPVDPDEIFQPIFQSLIEEGRSQLIVDLRKNGGGSTDAERSLLAHLIQEPVITTNEMRVATLNLKDLREHLSSYDSRALNPNRLFFSKNDDDSYSLRRWFADELKPVKPAKYNFDGELILLTSNDNSSASTNLLAILKTHRTSTTVGEKTGGSPDGATAGILVNLTLPESQIQTRIPMFRFFNNTENVNPGYGLTPDILTRETAESFLQRQDTALEKAKSLL